VSKRSDRLGVAKDTVADMVFRATEPFVRCKAKKDGKQCQLSRGKAHRGKKHEHGALRW
jgi:hypothetical protein